MTTVSNSLLVLFILLSSYMLAQQPQTSKIKIDTSGKNQLIKKSPWEGGLLLGVTAYTGDIELAFAESRPILGVFVRRAVGNYFAFQTNLSQGFLSGDEVHSTEPEWRVARKISFKSSLTELALRSEFHFLGNTRKVLDVKSVMDETSGQTFKRKNRLFSPFVYVGGGLVLINPKTDYNDSPLPNPVLEPSRIAADKAAKFSKTLSVIPFGGGLRIPWVNKQAFITIEGGFRPTFSDYLDGLSVGGNPTVNDWYFVGDIAFSKFFGNKKDSDGDGIADKNDLCPYMKGDTKHQGCPDRDNDGISDDKDACPTVAGLAIYEGCPDTDGDGIIDKYDDCPNERGLGQFKGCLSEKNKIDSTTVGLDTVKGVVDTNNINLNPVALTKPKTQNDSLSLEDNTLKPKVSTPITVIQKTTEKPEDVPKEVTVIEPEPPIDNKEKPKQVMGIQKDTPQYAGIKTDIANPKTAVDTTISITEKPKQVNVPQITPPQYVERKPSGKPTDIANPKTAVDTIVSVTEKPKQAVDIQKDTLQYVEGKPSANPTDIVNPKTAVDTTVSVSEKPKQAVDIQIQKDTPQYVGGKPIGHPTAQPEEMSKLVVVADTTIVVTENPSYLRPFPSDRNAVLDKASVPVTDTDNAFNIVRNNYTITPVYFETTKSLFKPESFVILDHVAFILLENPKYKLIIKGHTDVTGTKESNQILSVNRAKTCYEHLRKRGVPAKQMSFKGFGQLKPVTDNTTEASRQMNRRVEFEIETEQ